MNRPVLRETTRSPTHYYVDEAGDLTLFNRRKQTVVGTEGVSHCFIVGMAELPEPAGAHRKLEELRSSLIGDPYFSSAPSMSRSARKTTIAFHAKDDLPEVRREVFRLLPGLGAKVLIVVRRKSVLACEAQEILRQTGNKLSPDVIYDEMVSRLFRDKLHKAAECRIVFARRGKSERSAALSAAIERAKRNFQAKWSKEADKPAKIRSAYPSESAGLQLVDYYLWAVQRCFERGEDRFFQSVASQYRLIMDLDDTRRKRYGEWYSDANLFDLKKMWPVTSG